MLSTDSRHLVKNIIMIVEHVNTCSHEYIMEKESIPLVAKPYLSCEDSVKYVLDHKVVHRATSMLIT